MGSLHEFFNKFVTIKRLLWSGIYLVHHFPLVVVVLSMIYAIGGITGCDNVCVFMDSNCIDSLHDFFHQSGCARSYLRGVLYEHKQDKAKLPLAS